MFYLEDLLRTKTWNTDSQIVLRGYFGEVSERPGYLQVFSKQINTYSKEKKNR